MAKTKLANATPDNFLDQQLLDRLSEMALELKISQAGLVALAVEEFLQRQQTQKLLDSISEAYKDAPDEVEKQQAEFMRRVQLNLLEGDEW